MSKKQVAVTLRKPQASAEAFVAGDAAPPAPLQAAASPAANQVLDAASVVQHGARDYREMTLYLPTEVARALSFYCMDRNCDLNRVVADAVSRHVTPASESSANVPTTTWRGAVEILIEQSRMKLSTVWGIRRWGI
jgi:hypothetical protein